MTAAQTRDTRCGASRPQRNPLYPEQGLVRRRRAELAPLHPGGAENPAATANSAK